MLRGGAFEGQLDNGRATAGLLLGAEALMEEGWPWCGLIGCLSLPYSSLTYASCVP